MSSHIISIDGGAASGKSSTSRELAKRLNLLHVDTGSHYRSLTWALMQAGCDPDDTCGIVAALDKIRLGYTIKGRQSCILIDGETLTDAQIRSESVNGNVSKFASIAEVRSKLLDYQRSHADIYKKEGFNGLVMEGRDIGSVVFPDAKYRFYLHADEATRQARRVKEGQVDSIKERDKLDSSRKTAPLKVPEGAELVDTSHMTLLEVVDFIASKVKAAF
jgi:CMP/dCMP kinase